MLWLKLWEKVKKALDPGKFACGIFVDLQKAFVAVNRDILLTKIEQYGLCGTSKLLVKSHLDSYII